MALSSLLVNAQRFLATVVCAILMAPMLSQAALVDCKEETLGTGISSTNPAVLGTISPKKAWTRAKPDTTEREADFQEQFKEEARYEKQMLAKMQTDLPELYLQLQEKAREELAEGKSDFSYEVMTPVLQRIVKDLELRKQRKFGNELASEITAVQAAAKDLIENQVPYKAMLQFIFRQYLPLIDLIFSKRHPGYENKNYHRGHAEHLLERFQAEGPNLLLFFSFEAVTDKFFLKSRTAPLFLVGLHLGGLDDDLDNIPYADGFPMKNSEFSWHDMGHIEFMYDRDKQYIDRSNKPIERLVMEWEATRKKYMRFWDQFKSDQELYDAMGLLMFEIVHERGFQYSLSVLKKEFETPKWTEVIFRKVRNGYFDPVPFVNKKCFPRLNEARQRWLDFTKKAKADAQTRWFRTLQANNVMSRFIYNPPLIYGIGRLKEIEFTGPASNEIRVSSLNERTHAPEETDVVHLILPQVDPPKINPFGNDDHPSELRRRIQQVLTLKSTGQRLNGYPNEIRSIVMRGDQSTFVVFETGERVPLSEVEIPSNTPLAKVENLRFFEVAQALGSEERQTPLHYTIEGPAQVFKAVGRIIRDREQGAVRVELRNPFGAKETYGDFDITDLRVDSLNLDER